jgi:hypothetical protein
LYANKDIDGVSFQREMSYTNVTSRSELNKYLRKNMQYTTKLLFGKKTEQRREEVKDGR